MAPAESKNAKPQLAETCAKCERPRVFKVLARDVVVDPSGNGEPAEYSFVKCLTCDEVALFVRSLLGDSFEDDRYRCEYPAPKRPSPPNKAPLSVRRSYLEAARCEEAKAWDACAVMVGSALEAVAISYDSQTKHFATALKKMHNSGIIGDEMFAWADEVRRTRNQGAHPGSNRTRAIEASEALDLVEAMLAVLYDLRPKFERMKARRSKMKLS